MRKKAFALFLIIVLILPSFAGCWDRYELNQLGFSTALGIDKDAKGQFMLTIQVLNPKATATQQGTNEAPFVVYTETGDNLLEIIRKTSTQSPRRIVGTHMQTIIFGEEFARDGIAEIIDFMLRHYQTSSELFFGVAKDCTANELLNNITKLENDPAANINSSIQIAQRIWGSTNEIKLTELTNCVVDPGLNAVISGIAMNSDKPQDNLDNLRETQNDPLQLKDNAVFLQDKMVGWLDEPESFGFNYIYGNFSGSGLKIQNEQTGMVALSIKKAATKQEVTIEQGMPKMKVKINVSVSIQNMGSKLDISRQENINLIQSIAEKKIEASCWAAIKKTKLLKSDIFGFGDKIHHADPNLWKKIKSDWNSVGFVNLPVEFDIKVKILGSDSISQYVLFQVD